MKPHNSTAPQSRTKKREVILWGISHPVQRGDWTEPEENVEAFRAQVSSLALKHQVSGIAEEMSLEAMQWSAARGLLRRQALREELQAVIREKLQGVLIPSIPEKVAQELGIPYAACDPDSLEQFARGIRAKELFHFDLILSDSEDLADPEARWREETFPLREEIWVERLVKFDYWPVLYLCGKEHVEGFTQRLRGHGICVQVLGDSGDPQPVRDPVQPV